MMILRFNNSLPFSVLDLLFLCYKHQSYCYTEMILLLINISKIISTLLILSLVLQDSNLGLVKQVVSSLYKRNIQRLTQTYFTLSLQGIASAAQLKTPKETEMHVLWMVSLDMSCSDYNLLILVIS